MKAGKIPWAICAVSLLCGTAYADPVYVSQSGSWTMAQRAAFYKQDQGSQLIPLAWLKALRVPDTTARFLDDALGRYGYLPNKDSFYGLPVGFTASGPDKTTMVGMSCAACHTREIDIKGVSYRIDGGPALADFQHFLNDLHSAVGGILQNADQFSEFAARVNADTGAATDQLKQDVQVWFEPFDAIVSHAVPHPPAVRSPQLESGWGAGRLDAVGMIFDRVTGLDIGDTAEQAGGSPFIITANLQPADAPTRYPFLWDAHSQNKTQWPGFAANGNDLLGLARNLGEEFGVFGVFHPQKNLIFLGGVNFLNQNSANFDGLGQLEDLLKIIPPPAWPLPAADEAAEKKRAEAGAEIYRGKCQSCHATAPGATLSPTPVQNVGTDTREWQVLGWKITSAGSLADTIDLPHPGKLMGPGTKDFDVLTNSVLGSILQHYRQSFHLPTPAQNLSLFQTVMQKLFGAPSIALQEANWRTAFAAPELADLQALLPSPQQSDKNSPCPGGVNCYESRVLRGIWATAPYLHNGSVPTLDALLRPACPDADTDAHPDACRPRQFPVGRAYDDQKIGLAATQGAGAAIRVTTYCTSETPRADIDPGDPIASGNSRCGHEFGTHLNAADHAALLAYLKTL